MDGSTVATRYWHRTGDGRVQCDVCPRACCLHEGQRGFCFVRMRQQDAIVLTTYGRSSGYCVDPVEKKPLNHFLPGSAVLSFGTAGCNLGCRFCQNWDISKSRETDTLADQATPAAIARAAAELGCRCVAFTYNDPVIFLEYAIDVADACHQAGVKAVAVTAGYMCAEPRAEFFRHIDAANVDLKGFTGDFYHRTCLARLDPVLETLLYLRHETGVWLEITNLLIPGLNDSDAEIDAMTRWVAGQLGPDVPVHFTAFHPDFKMQDRPSTPPETLARARRIALDNGLRHAYTGNVHDPAGQSTRCHGCGEVLIERDWYQLGAWRLTGNGRCVNCDTPLAGVFDGPPGTWGPRRLPVLVANQLLRPLSVTPPTSGRDILPAEYVLSWSRGQCLPDEFRSSNSVRDAFYLAAVAAHSRLSLAARSRRRFRGVPGTRRRSGRRGRRPRRCGRWQG
jgi:pyruvate formate lyase activating enzyme